MRKQGARRPKRQALPPAMVALALAPEVELSERMALDLLRAGAAQNGHFNVLLDCQTILVIGASNRGDTDTEQFAYFAGHALKDIRARFEQRGRLVATGDELKTLSVLIDVSTDFWRRQSGAFFKDCADALYKFRDEQRQAAKQPTTQEPVTP